MPLNLYRRHGSHCSGGRAPQTMSYEADEMRRSWKSCRCPIYLSGTLGRVFRRKNTGCVEWNAAKAVEAAIQSAGAWGASNRAPAPLHPASLREPPSAPAGVNAGISIIDATESFLASRRNRGIAKSTMVKYSTFVKQLRVYCESRGYVKLAQLSVTDADRFYASWKDGKRSCAKKLERLKGFLRFALKRKWITENIAEDLEAPEGSSIPANKAPFTDAELTRIYAACDALSGPTPRGPGYR